MIRTLALAAALAVASLFAAVAPAAAAIECNQSAIYDSNATGATKLITGATNPIFVCGYVIVSGGITNASFKTGTGTNCGTGTAALTPAYAMVANGKVDEPTSVWRGLTAPAGKDICFNSSGTTIAVQAIIYYRSP